MSENPNLEDHKPRPLLAFFAYFSLATVFAGLFYFLSLGPMLLAHSKVESIGSNPYVKFSQTANRIYAPVLFVHEKLPRPLKTLADRYFESWL